MGDTVGGLVRHPPARKQKIQISFKYLTAFKI